MESCSCDREKVIRDWLALWPLVMEEEAFRAVLPSTTLWAMSKLNQRMKEAIKK